MEYYVGVNQFSSGEFNLKTKQKQKQNLFKKRVKFNKEKQIKKSLRNQKNDDKI